MTKIAARKGMLMSNINDEIHEIFKLEVSTIINEAIISNITECFKNC